MKKAISFLIIFICIFTLNTFAKTEEYSFNIPEDIRVGLYYNSGSLSSLTLKGNGDLQIGYFSNDKFKCLYELLKEEEITLKSDSSSTYKIIGIVKGTEVFTYNSEEIALTIRHAEELEEEPIVEEQTTETDEVEETDKEEVAEEESTPESIESDTTNQENTSEPIAVETIQSIDPEKLITVQGKQYRGKINLRRFSGTRGITVISVVNIQDYLAAVVPAEIGASSPKEAIKAQAISAKNFVFNRLGRYEKWGFDVTNTTSDQVYKAYDKAEDITDILSEIEGVILVYEDKLAETYFFSTSGGYTADVKDVWGSNYPYLVAVEDKYESKDAPKATWEVGVTAEQLADALKTKGHDLGQIKNVEITETDKVGRVTKIVITGTEDELILQRESARIGLGISGILSQWYTVTKEGEIVKVTIQGQKNDKSDYLTGKQVINGDENITKINTKLDTLIIQGENIARTYSLIESSSTMYRFNGKGWGHGVGMSQLGAVGMAKAGFTYDEILKWYYTGTKVINVLEGIND